MKLKVLQENLADALRTASRFTSNKIQLPVLANILLVAKANKLIVSSTNLEMSSSITIGAQITEEGEITIPSRTITELVLNLPAGTLSLESEKEQVIISGENFKSTLSGMNSSDYPAVPRSIGKNCISIVNKDILDSFSKVLFAVSGDETRPVLTGMLLILKAKDAELVATDGFRLSRKKIALNQTNIEERIILPKSVLLELTRLIKDKDIKLEYRKDDKQVIFEVGNVVLSSRVIEGEFPDFEKIIPKSSVIRVNLDKEDFLRAIKLASVFARDSANVVKITIQKSSIDILSESQLAGRGENKVDAKVDSSSDEKEGLTIAFNYRFLEDFLSSTPEEEVEVKLIDSNSPGVFTNPKDPDFLHLIMPVRIQS